MSVRLPIYEDYLPTAAAVEVAAPLDRDVLPVAGTHGRACTLCKLGERPGLRSPCITAEGMPGGLLVVGEAPGKDEDTLGRPFIGASGSLIRKTIKEHWNGPVAFDNALRCFPPRGVKLTEKMIGACRGYLTRTIEEVQPTRIIAVGATAAMSLVGRSVPPFSSRGAYGWLRWDGKTPIPVFFVVHPAAALRNRFVRKWFDADMKRALTIDTPPRPPWDAEVTIVNSDRLALLAEQKLMAQRWVSFDVETRGRMWTPDFKIISTALCGADEDDPWLWPSETTPLLPPEVESLLALNGRYTQEAFDRVRATCGLPTAVLLRILTSKKLPKVGQNVKYDQLSFRAQFGIKVEPVIIDTRLQRKLLDPEAEAKLGKMAELVGMGGIKQEAEDTMKEIVTKVKRAFSAKPLKKDADNREKKIAILKLPPDIESAIRLGADPERFMYALLPDEVLHRYNARDSVATKCLAIHLEGEIDKEPDLKRMWDVQVRPASVALERVEGWGVAASLDAIKAFDRYLEQREIAQKGVLDSYDNTINWNSDDQVRDLLFRKLSLPPNKNMLTDTGRQSVSKEALDDLAHRTGHPLPLALKEFNWVSHLRNTYASGLLPHVRADGRIHPNIKLDGARSGRTSCTDPNLQNIPRAQTVEGKMARNVFVAPPGYVLLEADYSQLELRIAAMLSGDKVMQAIFASGVDYHLRTAQLVSKIAWGIEPEDVTDKERSIAKTVNFGVLYGKTANTFAKEWGISKAKAQQIVDAIMGNFKDLQKWCHAREAEAAKTGFVWTWWNGYPARRRPLWRIADQDDAAASVARNGAKNTPIQGTASDFCIASLVQAVDWIESDGIERDVKLVLAVHDSLMFEVRKEMLDETASTVQDIMTSHNSNGVELLADFKFGDSWGSMHDAHVLNGKLVHSKKCKGCPKAA